MNKEQDADYNPPVKSEKAVVKKPYTKPAFIWERAFETMALSCGKVNATQGSCHQVRKNS